MRNPPSANNGAHSGATCNTNNDTKNDANHNHDIDIVLLGASGYVGSAVVRALHAAGRQAPVHALVRNAGALPPHPFLRQVVGALPDVPANLIPDRPHVVIHLGVKQIDRDGGGYRRTNVHGTANLLKALSPHTRGMIYGSSLSVLGQGAQTRAREDARVCPQTALAQSRADAERLIVTAMTRLGRPALCLRPRFVVGGNDRFVVPVFRRMAGNRVRWGSGKQAYSIIHCDDYAALIVQLAAGIADGSITASQPLHIGYRAPITYDDMLAALAGEDACARFRLPAPTWLLHVIRRVPSRRARALATKLELIMFDHYVQTERLESLVGAERIARDPISVLSACID